MEQIIENSLIAGALFVLIVLPFIVLGKRLKKKREAGMMGRLNNAARAYGLNLSRYRMINNNLVGWDWENRALIFAMDEERPEYINLDKVSRCHMLKKMNGNNVRSVSLELLDGDGRLINSIPFYRQFTDSEMTLNNALKYAAEWESLIASDINGRGNKLFSSQDLKY
jgi:hypothetical protein